MRKLDNLGPVHVDDADQVGANRKDSVLRIVAESPVRVKLGKNSFVEPNSQYIRKFLHTKWSNRYGKALKEVLRVLSHFSINYQQRVFVSFVQRLRHLFQCSSDMRG